MSKETSTFVLNIPHSEVERSGIDAETYVRGAAKRRAVEKSLRVAMVEYRFDDAAKMHRVVAYLRAQ